MNGRYLPLPPRKRNRGVGQLRNPPSVFAVRGGARLGTAVAVVATVAGSGRGEVTPRDRAMAIRQHLVGKMIDPARGLVLTRIGGGDPLEDTSLYGGFYLGALVEAWEQTEDRETAALARRLFAGLLLNATAGERGFIARGVYPDRKQFRDEPSVDQYTGLLFGFHKLFHSQLATPADRQRIREVFRAVLKRLERDAYRITTADGSRVTKFGHLANIMPTRSERLLSFLLAGAEITRESHWRTKYESARLKRMGALKGFERYASWVLIQTAASLSMLCDLEQRPEVLARYRDACREVTQLCLPSATSHREFLDNPRPAAEKLADRKLALDHVRIPIEAVTTVLLVGEDEQAKQVVPALREMLDGMPVESFVYSVPLVSLEWAYWLAVRRRLLT